MTLHMLVKQHVY